MALTDGARRKNGWPVDSITQAALGAAMGELLLGRKLGNRALAWGALFGTIPDLDVMLSPFLDTARKLDVHRGLSHSLLFMIAASFGLAGLLQKRWKRDKVSKARAGWFVFLALSTHVLIDCFTVYGTMVFSPFSNYRVGFNNLFIIDLFYTLPLLVTLVWGGFLTKKDPKRLKLCVRGLLISTGYVGLSLGAKFWVSSAFDADLARRKVKFERRMEAPTPFNILLWRSVVDRGDELWIGYRSVFESSSTPVKWVVIPRQREAFATVADTREAKTVDGFSDGWWIARKTATGVWLADMRFGETRSWEKKETVDLRPVFSWLLSYKDEGDRLRTLPRETRNTGEILKRMGGRIFGNREKWEGYPRLTGNPASLPEQLNWED
ncbi:MAG: hypothetical protein CFE26_09095 [Verrucomicrobiales bacterium VVV1]|nr:MAG: hypothetical protein CFE26_09095 [Verrucomicrobiales bacterium VVV1]